MAAKWEPTNREMAENAVRARHGMDERAPMETEAQQRCVKRLMRLGKTQLHQYQALALRVFNGQRAYRQMWDSPDLRRAERPVYRGDARG